MTIKNKTTTEHKIYIRQNFIFPSDFMIYNLYVLPQQELPIYYKMVISGEPTIRKYKKKIKIQNLDVTEMVDDQPASFNRITLNIPMGMPLLKRNFLNKFLSLVDGAEEKLPLAIDLGEEFDISTKIKKYPKNFPRY